MAEYSQAFLEARFGTADSVGNYHVYAYEWIDDLPFMRLAEDFFRNWSPARALMDTVKARLRESGWEGGGDLQIMWLPPFMLGCDHQHMGFYLFHVKQENDGISWLASPFPIPSLESGEVCPTCGLQPDRTMRPGYPSVEDGPYCDKAMKGAVVWISGAEVTLPFGYNDGLRFGSQLEIYRDADLMARVQVIELESRRSIGLILSDSLRSIPDVGDEVCTIVSPPS